MRSPRTATKSSPRSPQLEKKPARSNKDPTQPAINKQTKELLNFVEHDHIKASTHTHTHTHTHSHPPLKYSYILKYLKMKLYTILDLH